MNNQDIQASARGRPPAGAAPAAAAPRPGAKPDQPRHPGHNTIAPFPSTTCR